MALHLFEAEHFIPHVFYRRPVVAVYIGRAIGGFALGLFGVFGPIYFYLLFRDGGFAHPAALTALLYGVQFLAFGVLSVFAARLVPREGYRKLVGAATAFAFLYFVFLWLAQQSLWFIVPAVIAAVLERALFWPTYHLFFARISDREHRGKALSNLIVFSGVAGAVSPAVGGLIIQHFGYPVLFLVVLIVLMLSAIPYMVADIHDGHHGGMRPILREARKHGGWDAALSFAGYGIAISAALILWPLFLFLLDISFQGLGFITMAALGAALLTTFGIGRIADKRHRKTLLFLGAPFYAVAWVFRASVISLGTAFGANILAGLASPAVAVPFQALFYDRVAQEKNPHEQVHIVLMRELFQNGARGFFLIGAALVLFAGVDIRALLAVAVPAALLVPLIARWGTGEHENTKTLISSLG